jgi:serine/threonine-protein kinase
MGVYQLDDRIGGGGMADVYAAWAPSPEPGRRVALKRMRPELASNTHYKVMFCDEARIGALLSEHRNIVQLVDFDVFQREPFMVFEYIDGLSVSRLMRLSWVRKRTMPLPAALFVAHQILVALDSAHNASDEQGHALGIVHRDVSPENILVSRTGQVKLTDFGIVRTRGVSRSTNPGGLKGKLGYMSPEQIAGGEVDARSDLFSLGVVLAEMLTHAPLFRGLDELELLTRMYQVDVAVLESPALSFEMRALLARALNPRASQRFQTAREFQLAIEEIALASNLELDEQLLQDWFSDLDVLPRHSGTFRVASLRRAQRDPRLLDRIRHVRDAFLSGADAPSTLTRETLREPRRSLAGALAAHDSDHPFDPTPRERSRSSSPAPAPRAKEADSAASVRASSSRPSALSFGRPPEMGALWSRTLRRAELANVLCLLTQRRQTGLLRIADREREKRLYFEGGALSFISSTDEAELLGRRLLQIGLVRKSELERALASADARGCRVGEALVAQRTLRPHVVLRALIAQHEARFLEIGSWHEGTLAFFSGEKPGLEAVRVQAAPLELVFRLVRQTYSVTELRKLLLPIAERRIQRAPFVESADERFPFTEAERRALAAVDGAPSLNSLVAGLAAAADVTPGDVYRAVFLGLSCGALRSAGQFGVRLPAT